jgi:hypothetical protein
LTGLPPTPAEVDAFLADDSPDAYPRLIDRLLASPRYGERMAARWLDFARYADTNGYQSDGERFMWRWRDWVIEAYNGNLPFDRFTLEQLAGDLLSGATLDQRIATGFNRNHRGNAEGGIIPEEYAVEYVVDRVETTTTVWLGLTMGCARCHDHKYDPITQEEFYRVYAFFNNVPERGKAIKYGNSPPMIKAPTRNQQAELGQLEQQLAAAEGRFHGLRAELDASQKAWEAGFNDPTSGACWTITRQLAAHFSLDGDAKYNFVGSEPAFAEGRLGQAAEFDGHRFIDAGDVGDFGFYDKFSISAWIQPDGRQGGTVVSRMQDTARAEGYSLSLEDGKLHVQLVKRWLDDAVRVETAESLSVPATSGSRWHHVLATYDGSRVADGIRIYVDGRRQKLKVHLDDLNQSFETSAPLRIGSGGGPDSRFHGRIDDVRIYDDALSAEEAQIVATAESIHHIVTIAAGQRSPAQSKKLREYFLEQHAPAPIRAAYRDLVALRHARDALIESFPTTMVMQEMPEPRPAYVLHRGQYDKPGQRVGPGVPACLPPLQDAVPHDRRGFARWLVDPANPLVARVAVNRYWQMIFGAGLVKTTEDFGTQGEWPSHPDLLDWLATEYILNGWDTKALLKTIVTSATYRQSSKVGPALLRKDPENMLLARGPRFRLSAEAIRDQALYAAGVLVEREGGPSVRPYQPEGLWNDLTGGEDYQQDHGEGLYRRSLYTFWKRTVAPPSMMTFDASARETCTVRQTRTNTPLQALTLMNDVTFVEAARLLAQRALREGGDRAADRLSHAFRLVTSRPARPAELEILAAGFEDHLRRYRDDPSSAAALLRIGEHPCDPRLDPCELAAYTAVAGLILNLDEAVTKE